MFGSKKQDMKDQLIREGYEIKEFLNHNGDWYYFKVTKEFWGDSTVRIKEGWFGYDIEKV